MHTRKLKLGKLKLGKLKLGKHLFGTVGLLLLLLTLAGGARAEVWTQQHDTLWSGIANTAAVSAGSTLADGWVDVHGTSWSVSGGLLVGAPSSSVSGHKELDSGLIRPTGEAAQDQRVVFTTGAYATGTQWFGDLRTKTGVGGGDCYLCYSYNGSVYIEKNQSATATNIASGTAALVAGHTYRWDFSAIGVSPTALSLTVTDTTTSSVLATITASDSTANLQSAVGVCGVSAAVSTPVETYAEIATYSGSPGIATGPVTVTAHTTSTVSLSSLAASGGTAPYTYQWYRSASSGTQGSAISGATGLTLADTGLAFSTNYYYTLAATDNAAITGLSTQVGQATDAGQVFAFSDMNGVSGTDISSYTPASGGPLTLRTPTANGHIVFGAGDAYPDNSGSGLVAYGAPISVSARSVLTVEADIITYSAAPIGDTGIALGNGQNYYNGSFYLFAGGRGEGIRRHVSFAHASGPSTADATPLLPAGTYHLKLIYSGGVFSIYKDGANTPDAVLSDDNLRPNWVGVYAQNTSTTPATTGIHIKNFKASWSSEVLPPVFSVLGGYRTTQPATIALTAAAGATIRYTTDGTLPTLSSSAYSGPLTISAGETVSAITTIGSVASLPNAQAYQSQAIYPATPWLDTAGNPIPSGSGSILCAGGVYYWYGEDRGAKQTLSDAVTGSNQDALPISCYTSPDLIHWASAGAVLKPPVSTGVIMERPKVLYNAANNNYVMWLHYDNYAYTLNQMLVASAPTPLGPWSVVSGWPAQMTFGNGTIDNHDSGLFQDADGTAWVLFAANNNANMCVGRLNAAYTGVTGNYTATGLGYRESPAAVHIGATYYLLTSGQSGWLPNENDYATASSMTGTWTNQGSPFVSNGLQDYTKSYSAQTAFIFQAGGSYIWCGTRYQPNEFTQTSSLFLPMTFGAGTMSIPFVASWVPSAALGTAAPPTPAGAKAAYLTWAAAPGAQTYNVYRDGTLLLSGLTGLSSVDNTPGTVTHSYTVTALSPGGESAPGAAAVVVPSSGTKRRLQ